LARNLSDATRMDFVDLVRPQFRELMNLYSSRVPMWGSDAVRAAVIYLSLTAPEDAMHARDQYRAICTNSKDGMCSSVYAMKTLIEDAAIAPRGKATVFSGCLNANHKKELIFMIALRAFARANKNHKIIRNFDSEEIRDQVRKNILSAVQPIELKRLSHADA